MKSKGRRVFYNILTGVGSQTILIILGIVIPRLVITQYGSDANGVLSTISQIFVYVALLESGIGQATRNALFRPLAENDESKILQVMTASKKYFRKITGIYFLLVLLLAVILPFTLQTQMDKTVVFWVVFLEGMSNALPFYFTETEKQLINVDGKNYVISNINLITRLLMYMIKIILVSLGVNIVFIQLGYFAVSLFQVLLYKRYFKRAYAWVRYETTADSSLLSDRNGYMASEFAWTVFSSTDMIVLSMFRSTSLASVYSIYNMVYSYLSTLIESAYNGVTFLLGQAFHNDKKQYVFVHDMLETLTVMVICAAMSICYFLIMPFIRLYTNGITDAEYVISSLPILFSLVQILSWSRKISGNLTALAGYAKQVGKISMIEASSNIILSVILVSRLGMIGVLLATVITLLMKTVYLYIMANKKILKRSLYLPVKNFLVNFLTFLLCVFISSQVSLNIETYVDFFLDAIWISIIIIMVFLGVNVLFHYRMLGDAWRWFKNRKSEKRQKTTEVRR